MSINEFWTHFLRQESLILYISARKLRRIDKRPTLAIGLKSLSEEGSEA